jgi:hypothetical protein
MTDISFYERQSSASLQLVFSEAHEDLAPIL